MSGEGGVPAGGMLLRSRSLRSSEAPPEVKRRRLGLDTAVTGTDDGVEADETPAPAAPQAAAVTAADPNAVTAAPATSVKSLMEAEWFYLSQQGTYLGPHTADDLKDIYELESPEAAAAAGVAPENRLTSSTYVWAKDALPEWMPVEKVTELYEFLEGTDALRKASASKGAQQGKRKAQKGAQGPTEWVDMKQTTSIYVSKLPEETTAEDLERHFKKVGLIKMDLYTRKPKVKVYGSNDGLVAFEKRASVELALTLYDGCELTNAAGKSAAIAVEEAKFEQKGKYFVPRKNMREHRELAKKAKKMADARLSWDESREYDPNDRTVVLKNVFDPEDFRNVLNLGNILKTEAKEKGEKHGSVEQVRVYKDHPEGVILIRFKSFVCAQQCLSALEASPWVREGRDTTAYMWDNQEHFGKDAAADTS